MRKSGVRVYGNEPSAAQKAALESAIGTPSAANPFALSDQVAAPFSADAPWAVIASLGSATLLPAPPAGKLYFIHRITIVNNSASLTAGYTVTIGGKPAWGSLLTTSVAASGNANLNGQLADGAVVVAATGLAGITAIVSYTLISAAGVSCSSLALTNAYVAVPGVVPASGFVSATPFHAATLGAVSGGGTMNADASPATVTIRVTRGADSVELVQAALAAFTRTTYALPAIRAGDVVEAKVALSPAIAGKVALWMFYHTLPSAV